MPPTQFRHVMLAQDVSALQMITARAAVLPHSLCEHHRVVARFTESGTAGLLRSVTTELDGLFDLSPARTVLRSFGSLRTLTDRLPLCRHALSVAGLRTTPETLFAVARQSVGHSLVTPECRNR